jgi:hypothetical protein
VSLSACAGASSVTLSNGSYPYFIAEDVDGAAPISADRSDRAIAMISCDDASDSLTLNSTIAQVAGRHDPIETTPGRDDLHQSDVAELIANYDCPDRNARFLA